MSKEKNLKISTENLEAYGFELKRGYYRFRELTIELNSSKMYYKGNYIREVSNIYQIQLFYYSVKEFKINEAR